MDTLPFDLVKEVVFFVTHNEDKFSTTTSRWTGNDFNIASVDHIFKKVPGYEMPVTGSFAPAMRRFQTDALCITN